MTDYNIAYSVDLDDLVGQRELADLLGVRVQQIHQWEMRREGTKFPPRLKTLRMGPLYSRSQVLHWKAHYKVDKRPFRNRKEDVPES